LPYKAGTRPEQAPSRTERANAQGEERFSGSPGAPRRTAKTPPARRGEDRRGHPTTGGCRARPCRKCQMRQISEPLSPCRAPRPRDARRPHGHPRHSRVGAMTRSACPSTMGCSSRLGQLTGTCGRFPPSRERGTALASPPWSLASPPEPRPDRGKESPSSAINGCDAAIGSFREAIPLVGYAAVCVAGSGGAPGRAGSDPRSTGQEGPRRGVPD